MKLIKKTYLLTYFWLLPVLFTGSIFSFFIIEYVAYEEIDEFLTYEMERIKKYHQLNDMLPEYHNAIKLIPGLQLENPTFSDTLILEEADNEMIPYRQLTFSIKHQDQYFGIQLRHLMLGTDDVIQGTIIIVSGIMLLIAILLFLIVNNTNKRIWKPFYNTLEKLNNLDIRKPIPAFQQSDIVEFESLNNTLSDLLKKIADDYRNKKEFSENISHELQTHLAIIRGNAEQMLNSEQLKEEIAGPLKKIYAASTSLQQAQKSLFLLSKITNREYTNVVKVDIKSMIERILDYYSETISLRQIEISKTLSGTDINIDYGLAEILINNLVKNAIKHNIDHGFIHIHLSQNSLTIKNSGSQNIGESANLMNRFFTTGKGSMGIGLSIVKQICELYNIRIDYEVQQFNTYIITLTFNNSENN